MFSFMLCQWKRWRGLCFVQRSSFRQIPTTLNELAPTSQSLHRHPNSTRPTSLASSSYPPQPANEELWIPWRHGTPPTLPNKQKIVDEDRP